MRTITISRYSDLTSREWSRVIASAKRQVNRITEERCEIGLGRKFRGNQPYGWQIALRVYVSRKRKRVARSKRIPRHFHIRLRQRNGRYKIVRIRSDVDSRSDFIPTGGIARLGARRKATAGSLIRWRSSGTTKWGFLTVAHLLDNTSLKTTFVSVASKVFVCRLLRKAPVHSNLDVAIVEVRSVRGGEDIDDALIECNLMGTTRLTSVELLTTAQVERAVSARRNGRTFPPGKSHAFKCEEFFPDGFLLGGRRLDHCIRVRQSTANVFKQGTSGSFLARWNDRRLRPSWWSQFRWLP